MPELPRRNVELKAVDPAPRRSVDVCREIGANDHGTLWQRDTYFDVPRGRLKLREEEPGAPHLIQYTRDDHAHARPSAYRIAPVADAAALRSLLDACLGVSVVVTKQRHLFLWRNVRIHLDEVSGLGTFIELEAVAAAGSDLSDQYELIAGLRERFQIGDARLSSTSYADQLMRQRPREGLAPDFGLAEVERQGSVPGPARASGKMRCCCGA